MSKEPNIRFREFQDAWEEKSFSTQAETRRGLTYKPSSIEKDGVRVLRSSNIDDDKFVTSKEDVFVRKEAINIDYAKENDILITSANGSQRLVGKHCLIKGIGKKDTVHGGFMLLASANNPNFLNASMSSKWYEDFIRIYVAGGGGAIGNLNKADLDSQIILVPSQDEQDKIGDFFAAFDELIDGKQRELDKRRQLKAALLEQMFPAGGADTPKVRFNGFTEPWQRASLVDLFDLSVRHFSHSRDFLTSSPQQVATIHYGDILVKYGSVVSFGKDDIPYIASSKVEDYKSASLQDGDVVMADTAEDEVAGKVVEIRNVGANCIVAGLHTIVARPKVSFAPNYCGYFFNSPLYHNQLLPLMQGIKVLSINKPALEPTLVYYPSSLEEQEKIGNLLSDLDASISGIIEQMQKLRKIKKALLERMLI